MIRIFFVTGLLISLIYFSANQTIAGISSCTDGPCQTQGACESTCDNFLLQVASGAVIQWNA